MLGFLFSAWAGVKRGVSWIASRPWVGYLLAAVGIGVAYKAWKAEVARQARDRERARIALDQAENKAETILRMRQLDQEIREDADRARKAADSVPEYPGVDELRDKNPDAYGILFGADNSDGGEQPKKGR
jgi:hypothetical protein